MAAPVRARLTDAEIEAIANRIWAAKKREGRGSYPWSECMSDQRAAGHSEESARKICGSIRAKSIARHGLSDPRSEECDWDVEGRATGHRMRMVQ